MDQIRPIGLSACAPEVGSKEWCADMKEKNQGKWGGLLVL
ncbi:MAG: DUF3012 domain-containing protein [Proteobacteria bacterium]|nr:DUF3012 domain-containing protein [Pseudomonadota bacterium]